MIKIGTVNGDVIEAGGVKNVTNNYYGEPETKPSEDLKVETEVPELLATEEAMVYWQRLQESGFVNKDHLLMPETTRKQAMYIADVFAEKLGMRSKWKEFQNLWNINNLAQEKWEMQETGKTPARSDEIDDIFND